MRNGFLKWVLLGSLGVLLLACGTSTVDLYVQLDGKSPGTDSERVYSSIEEGITEIRELREQGILDTVVLHISAGVARLSTPISLDSSMGPLKILGQGPQKSVLKGSTVLHTEWKPWKGEIWVTPVNSDVSFDQLFVNEKLQILARYPNYDESQGHWQGHAADAISNERVKKWTNPEGGYVHVMHSGEWGGFHYGIEAKDSTGQLILTGGHQNNRPSQMHPTYRMVENIFEELDAPGEWFLEDGKLYFWPPEGLNIQEATFEAVVQRDLVLIKGSSHQPVADIQISGLRFEHASRTFMESYEPLLRSDWTLYRGAALFLEHAQNVVISDCEMVNLGGNAIMVSGNNEHITIARNHIYDIGASGIAFVGRPEAVRSPSFQYGEFVPFVEMDTLTGPKTLEYPRNCLVDDNLIHRIGRIEKQTAGVQIAMAMGITVSNNSIYDVPRAGINIGDGTWGGHLIAYNDVFNTVLESGDHGAFNSWGRDRFWHPNRSVMDSLVSKYPGMPKWDAIHTTVIRNNRFRCDHGWDIDLDDGSSNYHIYNNLCLNGGIKLREGFFRTVENNITINNGFHPHVWFKESKDIFRHNIVFTPHKDIRLQAWGSEVDYNLFPNQKALTTVKAKGVDKHSTYGEVVFVDSEKGNFNIANTDNDIYAQVGFKPFEAYGSFGVKDKDLRSLAKTPDIPQLFFQEGALHGQTIIWLGATIKNIETMAERSASGLNKTAGVLLLQLGEDNVVVRAGLQEGDVIVAAEGEELIGINDLMRIYQDNNWRGKLELVVHRNQSRTPISLKLK